MGDNDRINTMREAMIRELFADIDGLAGRISELQAALPTVAVQIEQRLQPLQEELTVIIGKLDSEAKRVVAEGKAALKSEGYDQGKKLEIRADSLLLQHASKTSDLIGNAVRSALNQPVADAVTQVVSVAKGLDTALVEVNKAAKFIGIESNNAVHQFAHRLDEAASAVAWAWWKKAALCFGSALIGGVCALGIGKLAGWLDAQSFVRVYQQAPGFTVDELKRK